MQITIHKNKLKDAVDKLRSSLHAGAVNPIMEHFLFEVKSNTLVVKSTNNYISTIWETKIDSPDDFTFTLPGLTLSSLVSSLEQEDVVISYLKENNDVTLTCGKYSWEAISGNIDDYPRIVIPEDLKEISLPENFTDMLKTVYFSISNDVSKPDLNSLCIDINKEGDGNISLISTDRIRLSCAVSPFSFGDNYLRFVIPRSSASEILKLEPTDLLFNEDKNIIYFKKEDESGKFILRTTLTNATYPEIYDYLNKKFEEDTVEFKKSDLVKALKRIKVTSDKIDKVGTVAFTKDKITITSLSSSSKSKEEVDINMGTIEEIPNPFNIKLDLMLEYLNQESEEKVNFKIVNNQCLVFDKKGYRHVLSIER
ncbi:DNA polymerase III subunit beta [bacterium]|nr:DNA polymerase III subunit beta [bacterium]